MLPIDFDTIPDAEDAGAQEMVRWKLKKLLPGVTAELAVAFREMPAVGQGKRLLVAATPADTIASIEQSFESLGVRVGRLSPASLALFEGTAPLLSAKAGGDYALLHRAAGSLSFLIARGSAPLFFRQRPEEEEPEAHEQELRLSLSYYQEKLQGPGLAAVFVHDERGAGAATPLPQLPVGRPSRSRDRSSAPTPSSIGAWRRGRSCWPGFAAVWGGSERMTG